MLLLYTLMCESTDFSALENVSLVMREVQRIWKLFFFFLGVKKDQVILPENVNAHGSITGFL